MTFLPVLLRFALVTGAYVGAAKLGIELPGARGVITPVWAPSGIALGALLILGIRYWPAVALGAIVANATSGAPVLVAAGIAVGNTLEPIVGATLVRRAGFRPALDQVRTVLALVVGAAVASTAIAATIGVSVLTLADETSEPFGSAWVLWWFGDAVGVLLVAPVLLVAYASRRLRPTRARLVEGLLLVAAVVGTSALVFLGGAWRYPYLLFPLLLWGVLRFRQLGAATTSFLVGAIATWGAVTGNVTIGAETTTERVQVVQALFGLVAASLLVLGATLSEREETRQAFERTAASLAEAQALAHVGSWQWDIRRDVATWSDELWRIFGLEPESSAVTYASYLERIHPEDRAYVEAEVGRAYANREPFAFEYRVVRPDGSERTVSSRGRVITQAGEPVFMLGTAQDVTEQRRVDRLREDILAAVSHELRTPLTAVLGFTLTLEQRREELPDEVVDEIVLELGRAARRLDALLEDLLDLERDRRGLAELRRSRADVLELVERVVDSLPHGGRRVRVTGPRVLADVDVSKVERAVDNLLSNALKHTPDTSAVEVRIATAGADLLLVVEDDGPGVAPEHRAAVFELFDRGPTMLTATPGTGIGLSLVATYAALHGGRAWVEDRPGGGASFRVLLPGAVVSEPDAEPPEPALLKSDA